MKRWYLLYTKRHQEAVALSHLSNQGFASFYPRVRKRGSVVDEPLFPCYIFVELAHEHNWRPINYTRGVSGFVRPSRESLPQPVRPDLIKELKKRDYFRIARELNALPEIGERVELQLENSNIEAIVQEHDGDERVRVLFKLLNQANSAWVSAEQLRRSN